MDDLDCTAEEKLKGAVSLPRDEAYQWWITVREGTPADRINWDFFKTTFQGKYVGQALQRERDLAILVEKAKIAEEVKRTERQDRDKDWGKNKICYGSSRSAGGFQKRAKFDGPGRVAMPVAVGQSRPCAQCGKSHSGECWGRDRGCFKCGSRDHLIRNCPHELARARSVSQGFVQLGRGGQQLPRGRGPIRGGNGVGRDRGALGRGVGNADARQPGLVYAARRREDGDAPDVITGTFLIVDKSFIVLIDNGSTHSYVACTVSKTLSIESEIAARAMTVVSPLGQSVVVNKLFRNVPFEIQGVVFPADLMELPFGEFDLILGMDWMVKHRANLDCTTKRMVLRTPEDKEVVMIRERRNYLANVVSALRAVKMVRKGCKAFLAFISALDAKELTIEEVRTVKEFVDVFPEGLPGLPPDREVEFRIELFPGTTPVSIAPYRMAPKELVELKAQIQELLDRRFIRPSVSSWGASV
ncbi:DNA/RNA polymerases superfamily protein [Gossypium australe]|uniref:DNA/RNA polymerases superfamily protein n=1 Tax=Gossypium australe TaxID=47621 RepID=A0A5B6VKL4_9ROSI|nr:DNA/RNA polymerases superfamily protein [Gossypium australe]